MKLAGASALLALTFVVSAASTAQTPSACIPFTVVTQDKLKNVKEGLSPDDAKWFREKMAKKYPGVCYADPTPTASTVFYITITPDTYNGTRIVNQTSTQATPVSGTITDQNGNVSQVNGTEQTTTTSSTAVPYSFEYGIFTLTVQSRRSDGTFEVVQTFQQKGIYNTLYGIPLGGRGHHPAHAVIEDAVKWVNSGGLADQRQRSTQPIQQAPSPTTYGSATLQARAQAGDAQAQTSLGALYFNGQGVPQDYAQATVWWRKAAEQGYALAQYNLGILYFNGQGVPLDYAQAAAWNRKSAEQGNALAQYNLGLDYLRGQGVPQDYAQSAAWFRKAAEQGYAEAQFCLGVRFYDGQGVPHDLEQSAAWFRKAAEQGLVDAQFILGSQCGTSQGVLRDYAECYFWLDLAASGKLEHIKLDDVTRQRDLAASYLTPAALSQAQARATKWFAEHAASK